MNRKIAAIFWQHVKHYPWTTTLIIIGTVAANIIEAVTPWYYKRFFDVVATNGDKPTAALVVTLTGIITIILVLKLARQLAWRNAAFALVRLESRVMVDLTQTAFMHLVRHSYSFFANNFAGALVRKVTRLARAFEDIADQIHQRIIPLVVYLTATLIIIYQRNSWLGTILLGWTVVFIFINYAFNHWKQRYELAKAAKDSEATGVLADAITNATTIKLFAGYRHEENLYRRVMTEWRRLLVWAWGTSEAMEAFQGVFMVLIEFVLFYVALGLWQRGMLTIGDFALIQIILLNLFKHIWDFGPMLRRLYAATADAAEMVEILETPHQIVDPPRAGPLVVSAGRVEFRRVTFGFHHTRRVLDRFNLIFEPGERVAIVGPSGAGKTTITHLLFRFYDIDGGAVLIDGQNIATVTQESLWENIALVPQEPILFHRTLLENIRYGRREATDNEVVAAAQRAHCHEFISELPQGYGTYVGERGIKLSGGERQRVAIARAILKNAPILVLDEATSSLDSESEALIQQAFKELMAGKTAIVIAHRLSTILSVDRIVVIDGGRIVDSGTHQALISKSGLYKKLWDIQAGGFIP